ncbi:MAG TPA: error-prone DNA polymerase [Steroidobacteraceae bacterium]|nr:error-prone DNA polymerase [Steroidobacteraceae bacterium]
MAASSGLPVRVLDVTPGAAAKAAGAGGPAYAELHCLSHFTFLRGASSPAELVQRALELGYTALAITDECSVAGVVRAHVALRQALQGREAAGRGGAAMAGTAGAGAAATGATAAGAAGGAPPLKLIIGAEFRLACGLAFVALAMNRRGYGRLCSLISRGRRAAAKGGYALTRADVEDCLEECLLLWLPGPEPDREGLGWLRACFPGRVWIAVELLLAGADRARLGLLADIGRELDVPLAAAGDVHMHVRARRALQDALTAIRHGVRLAEAGTRLYPNGERHLRERERLARLYPGELLAATLKIAERCTFNLDELRYEYPRELVPAGATPTTHLRALVEQGMRWRWPQGAPQRARAIIEHELALIAELRYEPYFLTVQDIVEHARGEGILCQGRGSAANSLVCYCLGITSLAQDLGSLLLERFISRERQEPPDIDVDFEHERREEVIQYIYRKYGRERAAIAATVISYRPRSALRDLGRVFGLDAPRLRALARVVQWWDEDIAPQRLREAGFDPDSPVLRQILELSAQLIGFPRHLSQHVGGFVICAGPLAELVPVENAAMPERTVVQWDKDDLDALGLLKVDVLALGMLSALRRAFTLVNTLRGTAWTLASLPREDPAVYAMMSRADTVGVFQIESRAQMSMLPRLKPRKFYDLVIQIAIVRPGPIEGDMVHPYLRRRNGEEAVDYPGPEVREILERTLGVPIFQEQVMQIAIRAAGFTPGEADQLRRAMAAWKKSGNLKPFQDRFVAGLISRNYPLEFAQRICRQIEGFGEYGFPESHSASFALLAYASAWLKHYEPAAFTCALLNSQPMGFYAPAQLVGDARAHGVEVRPVAIADSDWDCTLEPAAAPQPALRLGLRLVSSLPQEAALRIMVARAERAFTDVQDLARRARLERRQLEALAAASALASLSGHRHLAFWDVAGIERPLPLVHTVGPAAEGLPLLPPPTEGQDILADYATVGLTLGRHPLALLRRRLRQQGVASAAEARALAHGSRVRACGIVLMRQRPGTAKGVTFVTIEDETGQLNLVVWERIGESQRRPLIEAQLLEVHGHCQRQGEILHVVARRLIDRSALLGRLVQRSRDFH